MKMMKRKIIQSNYPATILAEHFKPYFAMSENQLKRIEGDLQTILKAQLTLILKEQGCKCPQNYCTSFRKLESAILYDKPLAASVPPLELVRQGGGAK